MESGPELKSSLVTERYNGESLYETGYKILSCITKLDQETILKLGGRTLFLPNSVSIIQVHNEYVYANPAQRNEMGMSRLQTRVTGHRDLEAGK